MKAFLTYLKIQFQMDLRDRGTLMTYYLVPLLFFLVIGSVFTSVNPVLRPTLAASMTVFAVTMGAVMGAPLPIVRSREAGTLRAFKASGIPNAAVLAVHGVSAFVHLSIVALIIYFVAPPFLGAQVPASPAAYFGILALFLLVSICLGLLIGVFARGISTASMLSMLVFFPTMMLSGIMFPASMLPSGLGLLGRIFPATHAMQAFLGFSYHAKTDISPGVSLAVLAGMTVIIAVLCAVRFNSIRQSEQR